MERGARTAAVTVRPGSVVGDELPDKSDSRVRELGEKRQRRLEKLKAMERFLGCPVDEAMGEDETLWRFVMRYFGESPAEEESLSAQGRG